MGLSLGGLGEGPKRIISEPGLRVTMVKGTPNPKPRSNDRLKVKLLGLRILMFRLLGGTMVGMRGAVFMKATKTVRHSHSRSKRIRIS